MSETADCFGRQLGSSPAGIYRVSMTSFRISVTVLAVIHAVFAGFTALVGAFANGGDVWQRLLVVLLHPLGAAGLLLLVLRPRLATTKILAMMALLTANVIADLWVAQMIAPPAVARGRARGARCRRRGRVRLVPRHFRRRRPLRVARAQRRALMVSTVISRCSSETLRLIQVLSSLLFLDTTRRATLSRASSRRALKAEMRARTNEEIT